MTATSPPLTPVHLHSQISLLIHNLTTLTDPTGEYLYHLPSGRTVDTKSWQHGWDWTHGIGLWGLWNYFSLTSRQSALDLITEWFSSNLPQDVPKNINTFAAMRTLAEVYQRDEDESYRTVLEKWAHWVMYEALRTEGGGLQHCTYEGVNEGELWVDTVVMTVLPLARIGQVLGKPELVEEAKRQVLLHVLYLFERKDGLWVHGWRFDGEGGGDNLAEARWGRGNVWGLIGLVEAIEVLELDEGDAVRAHLLALLRRQCRALRALQTQGGMWRTLLDVSEEKGSYVEASATAGFAYGILRAVRMGYISQDYREMGVGGVRAVLSRISEDGELKGVSFGTPIGHSQQHYLDIPRTSMPYGQAMAIMAFGEALQMLEVDNIR